LIPAAEALDRLREGNKRFVAEPLAPVERTTRTRRNELVTGQQPMAVILGCSDSRVPAEIVFDQGLGDLFVIRVAGNIVAPSLVGSVEFALEQFNTRLVVVLGHSKCGAVAATLDFLKSSETGASPNLRSIVDRIRPAVEGLLEVDSGADRDALVASAVRANIRASANQLRHGSAVIERMVEELGLLVVGAEYSLESGEVTFFDGLPEGAV